MKFLPLLGDKLSGSVGGITAAHNRGGTYFRQRATPTNPNTIPQQLIRSIFSGLQTEWQMLTQPQRDAWDLYAENVPLSNPLGLPVNVGGKGMYTRGNTPRVQGGLTRIDDGPTVFSLAELTAPTGFAIDIPNQELDFAFTTTDAWANETGGYLAAYVSRPQSPSINFFKGPYQLAGLILGDDTTPPTSPAAIPLPFVYTAGQKAFVRLVAGRADARISPDFRSGFLA